LVGTKYELSARQNLIKPKQQQLELEIEFRVGFWHVYKNPFRGSAKLRTTPTTPRFILVFRPKS